MKFIRVLFYLLFFSGSAYAQDYYWLATDNTNVNFTIDPNKRHLSAAAACQYYVSSFKNNSSLSGHSYRLVMDPGFSSARCYINLLHVTSGVIKDFFNLPVSRRGDSCPNGSTFDPVTGECKGDPCLPKKDQPQPVKKGGIKGDGWLTIIHSKTTNSNYYIYPPVACYQGCAVNIDSKLTCTVDTAHQYRCGGTGKYNGTTCSSQNPNTDPDPDGNAPEPEVKNEKEECVYGTVNGVTSCVKRNKSESEGVFGGPGTICTGQGCTGKDPKSKEDKIDTKITTSPNASGGIDTVKTDTKIVTTCVANATNCTTTTTVKTTTTKADANGNVTSTTGTCKGAQCADNTNPDSDGDGFGDCSGDDCGEGEEEEESKVSGEPCDQPLICEGDAIQCAILRQEKENNCKWSLGSQEEAKISAVFQGEENQIKEETFNTATLFSDAINQGRWLSASCPSPRTLNVMGQTITFSWEPVCQFAISIGPLIVAMSTLFFALFVFRGVKGS